MPASLWDPQTATNVHKLETVQRRSARYIMHNYTRHASVTTMLQHLDLPTLQQRRQHSTIIMLYRIRHQQANIPTATYIIPSTRNTATLHPALCTHTCISNIFLTQHHQHMEQHTTCHKQQHNHSTTYLTLTSIIKQPHTNTSTSGRHWTTLSAEAGWTPHAY